MTVKNLCECDSTDVEYTLSKRYGVLQLSCKNCGDMIDFTREIRFEVRGEWITAKLKDVNIVK